ncbi:MAG: GMC family oxidoreductase [Rhizobiales bacterium]|nr:GMC family oxidoreductase [Hyphomicrobiales bacterium]MDQ3558407.1 GMC family oxidoreductase [Pseudomonadota bacterium]
MNASGARPDVCIVGLGAAGATAAYALTKAGMRVVAIEAGPHRTKDEYRRDEITESVFQRARLGPKFNQELPTWRLAEGQPTGPALYSLGKMNNGVGGTVVYSAWLRRYLPGDFKIRTNTIARYGEDAIPPATSVVDWPIGYDDLEPYYTAVEQITGVAGIPGNIRGEPVEGGNPYEGYRSEGYPLPPLRTAGLSELFRQTALAAGYHPYPVPAGINSVPFDGRPACTYCGFNAFYGCHIDAKSTVDLTFVKRALATGNLDIRTESRVLRITTDERGQASGVDYLDRGGSFQHLAAPIVILAAYTFENVRLLLLSNSERFPAGLANGHGQVGKYFTPKQLPRVLGILPGRTVNRFTGPSAQGMLIDDFLSDNFDHTGLGFIRGASLGVIQQTQPILAAKDTLPPDVPAWGRGYKEHLVRNWNSIFAIEAQPEGLMYDANFLDLDPVVRDRSGLGLPVIRITFQQYPNELKVIDYVRKRSVELLRQMGVEKIWTGPTLTGVSSSHDLGGLRMGTDEATSVVDADLRTHEVPNLYVMSGAVFPSCPGINPTLTIQALSWRAADGIAAEWSRGRGL